MIAQSVAYRALLTGGCWFDPLALPLFFLKIEDGLIATGFIAFSLSPFLTVFYTGVMRTFCHFHQI